MMFNKSLQYLRFFSLCLVLFIPGTLQGQQTNDVNYLEYDIESLQALMQAGDLSSRQLVQFYLDRIEAIDRNGPKLNSIIEINPQAIEIATALDAERQASGVADLAVLPGKRLAAGGNHVNGATVGVALDRPAA